MNLYLKPNRFIGVWTITVMVTLTFGACLILLLLRPIAVSGDAGDILKILTGVLAAKWGDVIGFHINSSSGSKDKDDIMRNAVSGPNQSSA